MASQKNNDFELSDEEKKQRIVGLRTLLKGEESVKNFPLDDAYLERFLVGTHFNVDQAFERIKMYYELLLEYPDWFTKDPPLEMKKFIELEMRVALPETDREGRPIYIAKLANTDASKMTLIDVAAVDDIWIESIQLTNPASRLGLCVIIDIANFPLKVIKWITPFHIKMGVKKLQCLPFKEYRFHVVNNSMMFNVGIKILWPVLPDYIKEMVKFHFNDRESLYKFIDPAVLPLEYGGLNSKLNYNEIFQNLYDHNEQIAHSFNTYRRKPHVGNYDYRIKRK